MFSGAIHLQASIWKWRNTSFFLAFCLGTGTERCASQAEFTLETIVSPSIISAAYDRLGGHQEQLEQLIGKQAASEIVVTALGKEKVDAISIERTPYLEETRQVLEQSGGWLEIGTKIIAHLPPGTVKQWFEPRRCLGV